MIIVLFRLKVNSFIYSISKILSNAFIALYLRMNCKQFTLGYEYHFHQMFFYSNSHYRLAAFRVILVSGFFLHVHFPSRFLSFSILAFHFSTNHLLSSYWFLTSRGKRETEKCLTNCPILKCSNLWIIE